MRKYLTFILFFLPGILLAAPAPSGISGDVSDGSRLTVLGAGFGTKAAAAPKYFNKYDGESTTCAAGGGECDNGTGLDDSWYAGRNACCNADAACCMYGQVSTLHSRGTKSLLFDFDHALYHNSGSPTDLFGKNVFDFGATTDEMFISTWVYLDTSSNPPSGSYQIKGIWGGSSSDPYTNGSSTNTAWGEDYWFGLTNNYGQIYYNGSTTGNNGYETMANGATLFPGGAWYRLDIYAKMSSAPNTADSIQRFVLLNGTDAANTIRNLTTGISHDADDLHWRYVALGTGLNNTASGRVGVFYDDVYIDNTQARVEIGDASTWSACTHREVQPASSWGASSIQITVNRGSFPADAKAYLYVVDSTGAVNTNGLEITFGEESSTPAPPTLSFYLTNPSGSGAAQGSPHNSLGGYRSTTQVSASAMKNLFDDVTVTESIVGDTEYRFLDVYNSGDSSATKVQVFVSSDTSSSGTEITLGYNSTNQPHEDSWNGEAVANEDTAPASPSLTFGTYTRASPLHLGTIPAGRSVRICVKRTVTAGVPWTARDVGTIAVRYLGD